jgi:hypothetical protein
MSLLRLLSCAALALSALAAAPRPAAPAGVVVALAPPRAGAAARAAESRFAARLAALGLTARVSLAEAAGPATARVAAASPSVEPATYVGLEDFDPSRVWRLELADPATVAATLDSLRADPDVAWAEAEVERRIAGSAPGTIVGGVPDDPLLRDGRQWGLRNLGPAGPLGGVAGADIGALEAWTMSTGANDLVLAVADTGVDPSHPEFAAAPDGTPRLVAPVNTSGLEPAGAWADSFWHGTAVAGVFAARTGDGTHFDSLGAAGVCGGDGRDDVGCRLVPIKITAGHSGSATSFSIAAAAVHAVGAGARAMNLSFAGDSPSRVERLALHWALVHGCVVVCGAGNHGYLAGGGAQWPASFSADGLTIQVGASDEWDQRVSWSSYGPGMDVVAPGVNIWTPFMTYPNAAGATFPGGYARADGTSFAAPFATGVVGLLAALRPELRDADFQHLLREGAHDVGDPGVDAATGWGRLDAAAALRLVGPGTGVWHDEVAAQALDPRGTDTLAVGEGGYGTLGHWAGRHAAERFEATATVVLPDSFLGPVRAWPRLGGTTTVRGTWMLPYFVPWAAVDEWTGPGTALPAQARSFTLRGSLYRAAAACDTCGDDAWVPLAPEAMRFAFTVVGRVDRPPTVAVRLPAAPRALAPGDTVTVCWTATDPDTVSAVEIALVAPGLEPVALWRGTAAAGAATVTAPCATRAGPGALRVTALDERGPQRDRAGAESALVLATGTCGGASATLAAAPNPFRDALLFAGPARATVTVYDVTGRRRRRAALGSDGLWSWDGRDDAGRPLPAGLYFARADGAPRVMRLARVR